MAQNFNNYKNLVFKLIRTLLDKISDNLNTLKQHIDFILDLLLISVESPSWFQADKELILNLLKDGQLHWKGTRRLLSQKLINYQVKDPSTSSRSTQKTNRIIENNTWAVFDSELELQKSQVIIPFSYDVAYWSTIFSRAYLC